MQNLSPTGYALQISAKLAAIAKLPIPDRRMPQIAAVGPPEGRARDMDALMATHEFSMANARPIKENSENPRLSS